MKTTNYNSNNLLTQRDLVLYSFHLTNKLVECALYMETNHESERFDLQRHDKKSHKLKKKTMKTTTRHAYDIDMKIVTNVKCNILVALHLILFILFG